MLSAPDEPSVEVLPVAGGRLQPIFTTEIDTTSLIEGVLRLADTSGDLEIDRFPRRVVALRNDDLLNAYVECERVQLGENLMLLVKDDRGLPRSVRGVLDQIARPGFREDTVLPGLPTGWVLFADVQVVATPETGAGGSDLNALVPLLSSQLALAGGTKLPGGLRKWSSLDPPEIRAVVQGAVGMSVTLDSVHEEKGTPGLPHTWTSDEPMLVADINALALTDGDYEVSLLDGGKTVQQSILRLRSSNTPDAAARRTVTPLAHDLDSDPLAVLRATPLQLDAPAKALVRGPDSLLGRQAAIATNTTTTTTTDDVWWNDTKPPPAPPSPPITIAALDPSSCVVTGAHYIELPPADGATKGGMISGVCKYCGLVKRYPAFIRWHRDGRPAAGQAGRAAPPQRRSPVPSRRRFS